MDKKETDKHCRHCKKPLDGKAIQGLCPACLIKAGWPTAREADSGPGRGFKPPEIEHLRRLFPQLEILELIGQGGMGAVYKARQAELDRFVALKVLAPRCKPDPGFAERFTREARALARLNHPNIV
ncbi:MAG: protein kinase domain-containing protein, partial [Planctomycetota bacterium]